jgi:aryl-alcohol dehydrogenase-like predicted oxidoreductase
LANGVNLIDTSANYGDGRAEELIGAVVADLIHSRQLKRDAIVVISKVGYLQGQNYALSEERKKAGRPFPDLVEFGRGLEHCIHPEFIRDQLDRCLERLDMSTLDYYLLHNPEYYLAWAEKAGTPLEAARREYCRRIELAFRYLEEEVGRGRIQGYGISSNTFPYPAHHPQFTSLARVWEIAEAIGRHHFQLIQLPFNLFEKGAIAEPNGPAGQSVLALAAEKRLAVLVNRPLNAIVNNRIVRLADPPEMAAVTAAEVDALVDALVGEEDTFQFAILPSLAEDPDLARQLGEYLSAGRALRGRWQGFVGYANWRDIQSQHLLPRAQAAISFLVSRSDLPSDAIFWVDRYVKTINAVFAALGAFYAASEKERNGVIKSQVAAADADWAVAERLSQMAIRALRTTAGVTSVLVGMRQAGYVEDVLAELKRPATAGDKTTAWRALVAPLTLP